MRPILEQLDNDQAILLMYLADELPPADRAAIEARLASDENLRAEMEKLRATQESIGQSLIALDAAHPLAEKIIPVQRKLFRSFAQWQTDRAARQTTDISHRKRPSAWELRWLFPIASAAAAIIVLIIWWGWTSNAQLPPEVNTPHIVMDPNAARMSLQLDSRDGSLASAEEDLDALVNLRTLLR
ncbi:MAG TPA: hypothetical protein VKK61_12140 [Tepidisphaeraceae bacterium]|nr:hypothetical protein [Tepidisphaeraceae bacterium]